MIDPKLIDVDFRTDELHKGRDGLAYEPTEQDLIYAGAESFPDRFLVPRSEWSDHIEAHEKHKSSAEHFSGRFTHQQDSHECVCHAAHQAFMVAYNRQLGGLGHDVWFSPLALYTRITGGRRWGGSSVIDSLYEMIEHGMIPDHDGPGGHLSQVKKFKHTLHETSGRSEDWWPTTGWVDPDELPDGWRETAKHFKVAECWRIPDAEAHASAMLHGMVVVNGRQGHSIPHMTLSIENGRYLSKYKDSYNVFRYDSERLWGGGYCIRSVTLPDDPINPAGSGE